MSFQSDSITTLQTLISAITKPEGSGTLGSNVVRPYMRSDNVTPNTQIYIYSRDIRSVILDNSVNKRYYSFYVDILTSFVGREVKAQQDLHYLSEEVLEIIENNFSNATWADGYLDVNSLISRMSVLQPSHFMASVGFNLIQRVTANS